MLRYRRTSIALSLLVFAIAAPRAVAQDSQYWTLQHGNQARLLGGAVVGSVTDLSAVFYNPGLFGFSEASEIVLAGNVVRLTKITLKDPLGIGKNLSSTRLGGVPSLFAGELRLGFLGRHRLAYSFLGRHDLDIRLETRGDLDPALLGLPPALDQLSVNLGFESRLSDYWGGLTWAVPLGERMGLGVSQFVAVRSHRKRDGSLVQARADSAAGVALLIDDFDYQHWRLLWKVGFGAQFDPWRLGVAVTTPSIGLFGSGSVGYDETVVSTDLDGDGSSVASVISNFQDGLSVSWRSPLSVAVGGAYSRKGTTRVHVTAEWFNALGRFTVLDAEPVPVGDSLGPRDADVVAEYGSVVNFGIGVEQRLSPRFDGFASFRTDFSAVPTGSDANLAVATWDLFHVAGGAQFTVENMAFTFGAVYAFGNHSNQTGADLIPDAGAEDNLPPLEVRWRRLTFILGFEFGIE
jgi:hypothetical protein